MLEGGDLVNRKAAADLEVIASRLENKSGE